MDNEQQKDELTALESIYNSEEFSYRLANDQYEVTAKIFISLPEKYFFTYKDNRENDQKPEKVFISHLPPLTLSITIPPNYPSSAAPKFTLRSSWLSPSLITKLCKKLDQTWQSSKGQEILFTWVGFLQSETLSFLSIEEGINIDHAYTFYKNALEKAKKTQEVGDIKNIEGTSEAKSQESTSKELNVAVNAHQKKVAIKKRMKKTRKRKLFDERAISDIIVGKNPVQMLIDYNEMRNQIEFRRNFYSCKICFIDKLGEHCTQFLPCAHVFCKECILGYFEVKIKDGNVTNIVCPEEKCESEATPGQVKELVSPELFLRYDSMLLNATLDTMNDIIYCPRKSCQYPVSREAEEIMASCPVCQYTFCVRCKAVYHGIEPCKVFPVEKQLLIKEYVEASVERKRELESRYGKRQLTLLVENSLSENWIESNSRNCPHCYAAIEKSDGCNKMTCWKCNTFFCWVCNLRLVREDPYKHFRDPNSKCFNMLYHGVFHDEVDDEYLEDVIEIDDEDYTDSDDDDDDDFDDLVFYLNY